MWLTTELERAQASGCIGSQKGAVDDKLLTLIKRYEADLQEIHAFPNIPDEVLVGSTKVLEPYVPITAPLP